MSNFIDNVLNDENDERLAFLTENVEDVVDELHMDFSEVSRTDLREIWLLGLAIWLRLYDDEENEL